MRPKMPGHVHQKEINELISMDELHSLYSDADIRNKYVWPTDSPVNYKFGGNTYHSRLMDSSIGRKLIMAEINDQYALNLDLYFIVKYSTDGQAISLHQDNEPILDAKQPIFITSVGASRTLKFWDSAIFHCNKTGQGNYNKPEGGLTRPP